MDNETVVSIAKATEAGLETAGKMIDASTKLGRVFKGPIVELVGILQDRLKFARWERQLAMFDKTQRIMAARGLKVPTRELPLNFVVPLLTSAVLEEDDELQEIWARLLVNAGNATTEMELRTAYVQILRGMSAFDVGNLAKLAEAALTAPKADQIYVTTINLPYSSEVSPNTFPNGTALSREVGISVANLIRLGCVAAPSGFGGGVNFFHVVVTDLGLALYEACS